MRRSTKKFIASALGVSAAGLALPVLATGTAHATGKHCDKITIEYSLDDGKTWTTDGRMDKALVTKIQVRIKGDDVQKGCDYAVSLASYSAEGPTWETSGAQKFLGWDTTKLSSSKKSATLDVTSSAPKCFGQVDLYGNGKKYDGVENPLPHFKDAPYPTNLITAWNGGKACEDTPTKPPTTPPPTQATSKPPTDEGTKTPPPTGTPTTSPSDGTKAPPPSGTPTTTPSDDDTKTPPPATTQPAPGGGDSTPPVGTPEVPPMTEVANAELAETGGNDNTAVIIGSAAGALLVGGAGVLVWNRRRNAGGTPA